MKNKFVVVIVVIMIALIACTGCSDNNEVKNNDNEQIILKVADYMPETHFCTVNGMRPWMQRIEELTEGKVKFEYFPSQQLCQSTDTVEFIRTGGADIGNVCLNYVAGTIRLTNVGSLPGLFSTSLGASLAATQVAKESPVLEIDFLENGIRPMIVYIPPPYDIYTTKQQIKTVSDAKGLKIRSAGGIVEKSIQAIGAVPVNVGAPEAYEAMQKGVLDGTIFNPSSMHSYKLDELSQYATWGASMPSSVLTYFVNENVWQGLPEDVKQAFEQASEEIVLSLCKLYDTENLEWKETFMGAGMTVTDIDTQEWKEQLKGVKEEWVEDLEKQGLPARIVLEKFVDAISEFEKPAE